MWFTEDPWPPMVFCGLGALLAIGWWASSRRVAALAVSVGSLLLGGLIFVVEQAIVTPAEEVEQLVTELCWKFQRQEPQTLDYFSDSAPQLRLMCQLAMGMVTVDPDLRVSDFETQLTNENSRAICHFRANATISLVGAGNVGRQPARFRLTWGREGGEWKIVDVRRLNPIRDEEIGMLDRAAH